MTEVNQTKYYRIQNQVSQKYLLAGSWGKSPTDYSVWQYGIDQEESNSFYDVDGFLWQIVPVATDSANITWFRIINKVSGFQLCAGSWGTVPSDPNIKQYPPTYDKANSNYNTDGFLWQFDGTGNVINKVSGRYLLAGSWGIVSSDNWVWQYALTQDDNNPSYNANGFHWNLEAFSDVPTKTIYVSRKGQSNNIKLRDSEGHQGGRGNGNSGNDDDITTSADYGNAIVWELDTNDHPVSLYSLNGIFKKSDSPADILVGTPAFYSGQYQATVLRDPALANQFETYNIKFQVDASGPVLEDDPKLKLEPSTTK